MSLSTHFLIHFAELEDPRIDNHNKRHNLHDILVITILGSICGADSWTELVEFGCAKEDWLKTFLELPNGIPSHDTFGRVFSLIDPKQFERCFFNWISSLSINIKDEFISIDGKSICGSAKKRKGTKPLHLVSAWASKNRIMLGQVKTEEKSNEIKAIPELLEMIDVSGAIVTIDAMGCQKKIAEKIVKNDADYVLSLKKNQAALYKDVVSIFEKAEETQYKKMLNKRRVEKIHDHGRIETRRYTLITPRESLLFSLRWPKLRAIGKLEVTRTTNNKVERSTRYFLTSLDDDIEKFMTAIRSHWNIEINLHWNLDVSFSEDLNQTKNMAAAENLSLVRRIALNLLKQSEHKRGIKCRRKRAGWDNKYLLDVLNGFEKVFKKS